MWDVVYKPSDETLSKDCAFCKEGFNSGNRKWDANYDKEKYVYTHLEFIYCSKTCAKSHEKELIKQGKIILKDEFACPETFVEYFPHKDEKGNKIWFPKDGKPYFDPALKRTFNTAREKADYMKEKKLIMDGSESRKYPIEAGDVRSKEYRRRMRMED